MPPKVVQEAKRSDPGNKSDPFLFVVCQHGLEPTIKRRWLTDAGQLRLAFSRPGLLTFKVQGLPDTPPSSINVAGEHGKGAGDRGAIGDCQGEDAGDRGAIGDCGGAIGGDAILDQIAADWPVRLAGWTLCNLRGPLAEELAAQAVQRAGTDWDAVHVFQRDPCLVGWRGYLPGPTELTSEVGQRIASALAAGGKPLPINQPAAIGHRVLDVVLVEPDQWLVGWHPVTSPQTQWPGGAITIPPPPEMISRAYVKIGEALAWSGLPIEAGDEVVEIGSAPGGSSQRLLDLGLRVTGVDPAEMDPLLNGHPRFDHWRAKSSAVRRRRFAKFRWLVADANVAPNYTLDAVEDIVRYPTSRLEGLLLTLKLSDYELAEQMDGYLQRIASWGFDRVQVRQLSSNRRECCVVAQRLASH